MVQKAREYCLQNDLAVTMQLAPVLNKSLISHGDEDGCLPHLNSFKMQTFSSVKTVQIDDLLYKFMPLQQISGQSHGKFSSSTYQMARVNAVLRQTEQASVLTFHEGDDEVKIRKAFMDNDDKACLFFWHNQMFSLRELQRFLASYSIQTILFNGCLNFSDKVYFWIGKDKQNKNQLRLKGEICKEYFQIRKLVYQHFGKV